MSKYQALYRAWRPEKFADVYGQEMITRTLRNQVMSGRIPHAYLFCGSRGTGKTSTAKILARALNCRNPLDGEPCGECEVCAALKEESSLDVLEIDAASNNGVDEVRALRDRIAYPPTLGRFKVYIIDEVHMLSTGAFNALLKTLEEPPEHAVFILATTEPQKLPATVLSRCQRYDFKRLSVKDISARLRVVLSGIGRECTDGAIEEIAVAAEGGMRDALSLMDMCLGYTDGTVDAELVREVLGSNGREFMFGFVDALEKGDSARALTMIDEASRGGRDMRTFAAETAAHMRTLLIGQMTGDKLAELADISSDDAARFLEQGKRFENRRLMRAMDMFIKLDGDLKYASSQRALIEMCAVRAARVSREESVDALTERVEALEKQLREGTITVKPDETQVNPSPQQTADVPKPEAPAPAQTVHSANKDADVDENKRLFDAAIAKYAQNNAPVRGYAGKMRYIRTEENTVFAGIDSLFMKQMLERKQADIEQALSAEFGRAMKLNLSAGSAEAKNPAAGTGAKLTRAFDVFGRENVEVTD